MSDPLLVAAIDFGTTFSSWGFSFRHEFELEPTKVTAKQWTGLQSAISLKGPTSILIKPDGKTFDSFGFDAETRYVELAEDQQHKEWYFFKRFKMQLFGKIGLQRDFEIEDATGKPLKAKLVFSLSIQHLKNDLLDMTKRRLLDQHLRESDIRWVLTIPAIWNDAAKQFMREAGEAAGIKAQNLMIALEPEAASLYCRHLPTAHSGDSLGTLQAGNKYLILDAGGGTVDITVHEITPSGSLKEVHRANGGDWGGTIVDRAFEDFLSEITGKGVIEKFTESSMEDYLDFMRSFEVKKREMQADSERQVTIKLPVSLINLAESVTGESIQNTISTSKYRQKATLTGDKLRLSPDVMIGFFENSLNSITEHLKTLFQKQEVEGCEAILMVGGYSESVVLQKKMKERFPAEKVVVPADAGLAVLKGAVIFGHNPTLIAQRVCKYTYGNHGAHEKSPHCTHAASTITYENDTAHCSDIFYVHVRAGDVVKLGEEQRELTFCPMEPLQTSITFGIYCTEQSNPELVTEPGCVKLGSVEIPMPDTTGGCGRRVGVKFLFGGTEIEVKVRDKTEGTERNVRVSFLG